MGAYDNIESANSEGRFPFINTPGRHVCAIVGWKLRPTRKHGEADFCDFKVLKSDTLEVGSHHTRMRTFKNPDAASMALAEVKQRAIAAFNAKGIPSATVTGDMMKKIVDNDGGVLKGAVIVLEIGEQVATKSGQQFTPITYFVPTARELEGVDLG
jgi:hypothetical protein